jgi:hypothetical protein
LKIFGFEPAGLVAYVATTFCIQFSELSFRSLFICTFLLTYVRTKFPRFGFAVISCEIVLFFCIVAGYRSRDYDYFQKLVWELCVFNFIGMKLSQANPRNFVEKSIVILN